MYTGGLNLHNNRKLPNVSWGEMDEQHEYYRAERICKVPNMNRHAAFPH
jgi:hypothetical protein